MRELLNNKVGTELGVSKQNINSMCYWNVWCHDN